MKVDHVCFYVDDTIASRDWFIQQLGFRSVGSDVSADRAIEVVNMGAIYFVLCAALVDSSPIATFLQRHPPGVADVAFCVENLEATIAHAVQHGATLLRPLQTEVQVHGTLKWATLAAEGDLVHTLMERSGATSLLPQSTAMLDDVLIAQPVSGGGSTRPVGRGEASHLDLFTTIDHVVLNVAAGDLERSVAWYERILGLQPQQGFAIQTTYSALCSRVMRHPSPGGVQLPINEPASPNSQIQEFLNVNHGPGIQHIALKTTNLVQAIAQLRQRHLPLIHVPATYYAALRARSGLAIPDNIVQQLEQQQILADWQPDTPQAVLLQTFTQPIFPQPTFFFELIQRQPSHDDERSEPAQGFGEGNFRALFEAIEREQMRRGSLQNHL
ncbi:4-hydroxyphenylpyruvate dioxygenase [Stenomitos frigidus]|uniref:4-hydroxyphenylpyruvate dioxygenase n=1 Tax=Stenomitos frigidus ULC18 TaxID=2107698 RepID=A0A2T1EGJ6_9CYAN|nr:4-hydroxyphenylpyruvate dioxygenase [Stenomitos frigidus]PSB31866.1 4-hydroxyphenylpyruvate dioxygenase [Stenomitos frigidus ULC18]